MSAFFMFIFYTVLVIAIAKLTYWYVVSALLKTSPRADEEHVITTQDGWRIKLFRYRSKSGDGEPVFLCHGLAGNQYNYSLPEGDSLVDSLVAQGYDCWLIDLRGDRSSIPPFGASRFDATFDGYLLQDLPRALAFVREKTGHDQVHWVGHSMGGLLLFAYALVHGTKEIASGTTLGSLPGFVGMPARPGDPLLKVVNRAPWIVEKYLRALSPLAPLFRVSAFFAPINWKNMHTGMGAQGFYSLVELPPPAVMEFFVRSAAHNAWKVNGDELNLTEGVKTLELPLMLIYGASDPFAPPSHGEAFFNLLPGKDKRLVILSREQGCREDYNHVDLVFSPSGPEEVYAPIGEWIAEHGLGQPKIATVAAAQGVDPKPVSVTENPTNITRWNTALESAASVLSDLEGDDRPEEVPATRVKLTTRKAAAKRARAKKKKSSTKKKATKKKSAKKKSAKKKTASKKPKTASKSPKKKAAAKKKKPASKKAAKKKSASKKNPAEKKAKK